MTTFKFKNGREVEIRLVSVFRMVKMRDALRQRFIEEHGELEPPKYSITLGGGPYGDSWTEEHKHTAETIGDGTKEEREAWAEYQRLSAELSQQVRRRSMEIYLRRGVIDDPPDDGWEKEQIEDGIEIPEDPAERKQHWIETELLTDNQELFDLLAVIQGETIEVQEAAKVAASMFQHSVGREGRDAVE